MKIKSGFTLSEVLVTMGLIGVVAVITLTTLNRVQPNQEMVMVKKTYYNISRIVSELINDDDLYPDNEDDPEDNGFANVEISDQAGGQEAMFHGYTFQGDPKFCGLFAAKLNVVQGGDPNLYCQARVSLDAGGNFSTVDGVVWSMPIGHFETDENIYVDVDGPDKGHNCTKDAEDPAAGMTRCAAGVAPDRFTFTIGRLGNVSIPGRVGQLYATSSKVNRSYGDFLRDHPEID